MNTKTKLIIGIAVSALIITGAVFASMAKRHEPHPKPSPTAIMGETGDVAIGGDGKAIGNTPADGSDDVGTGDDHGTGSQTDDLTAQVDVARAAVTQFLQFSRSEPAAARTARLAPYLAAGSTLSSRVPALAQESKWGYVGFEATVAVSDVDYISVSGINDAQTMFKVTALITYEATYTTPTQSRTDKDRKIWDIWVTTGQDPKVYTIDEPQID